MASETSQFPHRKRTCALLRVRMPDALGLHGVPGLGVGVRPFCKLITECTLLRMIMLFSRIQTAIIQYTWTLYREQNAAKIYKNMGKIFGIQYYGRLKELFDFNKLAKINSCDYFRMMLFYNEKIIVQKL